MALDVRALWDFDDPAGSEARFRAALAIAEFGVPAPIVTRLHATLARALQSQDMKDRLTAEGGEPIGSNPQAFYEFIKSEIERWHDIVKKYGIVLEP